MKFLFIKYFPSYDTVHFILRIPQIVPDKDDPTDIPVSSIRDIPKRYRRIS